MENLTKINNMENNTQTLLEVEPNELPQLSWNVSIFGKELTLNAVKCVSGN